MTRGILLLIAATLLAACGGQSAGSVSQSTPTPASSPSGASSASAAPALAAPAGTGTTASVAEVNAPGMGGAFSPASLSVHVGDSVEWTNKSGNIHNVTFAMPALHSPVMFAGERWKQAFSRPGTFHYSCTYHPGMEGEIVVS